MHGLRFVLPLATLIAGVLLTATGSQADVRYSKQHKRPCITCHTNIKGKELNKVGRCFKEKKTLDTCDVKK